MEMTRSIFLLLAFLSFCFGATTTSGDDIDSTSTTPMTTTQNIDSNLTTTQDIDSNLTTTQDIDSNLTTTQDIDSNLTTPMTTTQDIDSNLTTTQDIDSNLTTTQDIDSNLTTTQDIDSNLTTTQDIDSTSTTPMTTTQEMITESGSGDIDSTSTTPMPTTQDIDSTSTTPMTTTQINAIYNTPVEVEIADTLTDGNITFYCNFALSNESLVYKVIWKVNDKMVANPLGPFNSNVQEQSKLLESSLTDKTAGFQIRCAYQVAVSENSAYSVETSSPQKFVGIEILTKEVSVSNGGMSSITIQATAPIGCNSGGTCSLGINIYNQDSSTSCSQPTTAFSECQVQLKANEWNKPFNLSVTSGRAYRYGIRSSDYTIKLQTQSDFSSHSIWQDYDFGTVKVGVTQDTTQTEGKSCYAVCDPHMKNFEYDYFEHQYLGKYTLYENKAWKQEIQIHTEPCFGTANYRPYCVCGLAIRAGKEVYIMDRCSPRRYWSIKYVQCDPTRSGLINVVRLGSQYSITLPSGTVVKTNLYTYSKFLNLYVYPSESDINKADGLCGRVGDPGFYHRDGTKETKFSWYGMDEFSESWSVSDSVSDLFSETDRENLDAIGNSAFQCMCAKDPSGLSTVQCDRVDSADCTVYFGRARKVDDCKVPSTNNRKKRSIQQSTRKIEQTFESEPHTVVKRSTAVNWTEETATTYCTGLFDNSTAVQACKGVPGVDFESPKNNCIVDIQLAGDTSFALTAIESIKNKCFKEVGQNSTLQNSTDGTPSILNLVQNIACPFECNGQGTCTNGTCNCNNDFASDDCSIDLKKPPLGLVEYEDGDGECDLGSCSALTVSGGPFVEDGVAKCRIISKNLMPNGSLVVLNNVTIDANIISIGAVECSLPTSKRRKRAAGEPEMEEVTVYEVSVSNGGSYSDSNLIIARHADCHNCNVNSTFVSCTYTGCYAEGNCYQDDAKLPRDPCFSCDVNNDDPVWIRSTSDGNCTVSITPVDESEDNLLWVIGAVLGAVALIVIIVVIVLLVVKKKNKRPVTPIINEESR